jgi:hypothetical protein
MTRYLPRLPRTAKRAAALLFAGLLLAAGLQGVAQAHPEGGGGKEDGPFDWSHLEGHNGDGGGFSESFGVTRVGHTDPGTGFNADVVAHRRHAYLGSWGTLGALGLPATWNVFCQSFGVRVFDLHDPSDPVMVSTFADGASEPDLAGTWTEKVIVDSFKGRDIAVVSFQNCARDPNTGVIDPDAHRGWGLYDVTDPANPQRLSLVFTDVRDQGSHEIWLEKRGNKLYVYTAVILSELLTSPDAATPGVPDFQIWDVSDPTDPVKVGEWGAWAELGVHPTDGQGAFAFNFVHSVVGAIVGNQHRAYLSYWDLGTIILDVSDPANPQFIGRTEFTADEEGNAHSAWLARGGNILIQADEDFTPVGPDGTEDAWGYARIFDISDPANPAPISTFEMPSTRDVPPTLPGFFTVHDPKVRGNTLYLSYYAEGVVMLDISRPASPEQFAQFVPDPHPDPHGFFGPPGVEFPNVWGVFVERNYVLASDINSGLWVFRLDRSN